MGDLSSDKYDRFDITVCTPSSLISETRGKERTLFEDWKFSPGVTSGSGIRFMQEWDKEKFLEALRVVWLRRRQIFGGCRLP
jgi:hypothetical protein